MNYPTPINPVDSLLARLTPAAATDYRNSKVKVSDLPALLAEHRAEKANHYSGKAKKMISFSEIDYCSRRIAYSFFPEMYPAIDTGDIDVRDEAAVIGTVGHAALQKAADTSNLVYRQGDKPYTEVWASDVAASQKIKHELWNTYKLTGKLDMVESLPGQPLRYTELKFVKDNDLQVAPYWFKESKKTPGKINMPFWFKPGQAQLSMWALDVQTTRFILVSREGDWVKDSLEFFYERDNDMIRWLLSKAEYIHIRINNIKGYIEPDFAPELPILKSSIDEMLPVREPGNCKFCPFITYCEPEGN